jgi:hypothetical protein
VPKNGTSRKLFENEGMVFGNEDAKDSKLMSDERGEMSEER